MNSLTTLLTVVLVLFSLSSKADTTSLEPLLAAENSWPPYSNKQGEGISKNIISAAFSEMNISPQFITVPYARVLHMTATGAVDGGFNVTRQESTENTYLFGQEPLFTAPASWYFASNSKNYRSISELPKNLKIGLIIGYEYGDVYEQKRGNFREIRVNKQRQLVKMLNSGRIDAAIMFDRVAEHVIAAMNLPSGTIKQGFNNHNSDIYLAFSLKNQKSSYYAEQLDLGLRKLKSSNRYQQLLNP